MMGYDEAIELIGRGQTSDFRTRLLLSAKAEVVDDLAALAGVVRARQLAEEAQRRLTLAEAQRENARTTLAQATAALQDEQARVASLPLGGNLHHERTAREATMNALRLRTREQQRNLDDATARVDALKRLIGESEAAAQQWRHARVLRAALAVLDE